MSNLRLFSIGALLLAAVLGGAVGCNQSAGKSAPPQAASDGTAKETAPGAAKSSLSQSAAQTASDERFSVPEGSPTEVLAFIERLAQPAPFKSDAEVVEYQEKATAAIGTAADRVLAGEPTEEQAGDALQWKLETFRIRGMLGDSSAAAAAESFLDQQVAAKRVELKRAAARLRLSRKLTKWESQDLEARLATVTEFIDAVKTNGLTLSDARFLASLADVASKQLFVTSPAAAAPFRELPALFRASDDPTIAEQAKYMEAVVRRLELPGQKLALEGKLLDGTPLDWESYRGKVVLVDFWATDCEECLLETPNVVRNLKMYRDKGFEVLGVNLNGDAEEVKKVVQEKGIVWPSLFEPHSTEERWAHPAADLLGIDSLPQMVLVDQQGTVVHANAIGTELGDELKKLLGEPAALADAGFTTTIPDGSVVDVLQFVESQIKLLTPPRNMEEQLQNRDKVRTLFNAAIEKILAGEPTVEQASQVVEMKFTTLRLSDLRPPQAEQELDSFLKRLDAHPRPAVAAAAAEIQLLRTANNWDVVPPAERTAAVDKYVALAKEWGPSKRHVSAMSELAMYVSLTGDEKIAAQAVAGILPLYADRSDPKVAEAAEILEGLQRRLNLPGTKLELEGALMDGAKLNWESYRGKVVLVDFWASWCGPCREEIPNILRNYKDYHDKGFEVLGICLDDDRAPAEAYIQQAGVIWPSIFGAKPEEAGFDHPIARHYGITGVPLAILVDREGKVVTLLARGPLLGMKLRELLGDPAAPSAENKEL